MGYSSKVVISISKPAMAYCIATGVVFPSIFQECLREKLEFNEVFIFEDTKWYESYPEVAAVYTFIDMLNDVHDEIPPLRPNDLPHIALMRVGEDPGDVEHTDGAYEHGLCILQSIDIDYECGLDSYLEEIEHAST
jgi:hypothetical protein|tara:strand:+ start:163 stop:570 length:408 start_codon:yes stop_codon:yes gene_type:complete